MTQQDITVWGVGTTRTLRAHWALAEAGIAYETKPIQSRSGETQHADYTSLNPKQKIPFLTHGGVRISESYAIVDYVFEVFGGDRVYRPSTAAERAASNEWCSTILMELDAHTLYVMRRHGDLKDVYGEAPAALAAAKEYFTRLADAMVAKLPSAPTYLLSDKISVADILLVSCLDWAMLYQVPVPEAYRPYRARIASRAAYQKAFDFNFEVLGVTHKDLPQ